MKRQEKTKKKNKYRSSKKKGKGLTPKQLYALVHSFHPTRGDQALPELPAELLAEIKAH